MKRLKKVLVTVLLTLVMVYSVPMNVLAENKDPDRYEELSDYRTIVRDVKINVYVTKGAGSVSLTDQNNYLLLEEACPAGTGFREYTASDKEGWVWKGWSYEQILRGSNLGNDRQLIPFTGYLYSFTNDGDDWFTPYDGESKTISVNRLSWRFESAVNPIEYNIYADYNPTITASASEGGIISDSGVTEVNYGEGKTYSIVANDGMAIGSLKVNDVEVTDAVGKTEYTYEFTNVTSPQSISVIFGNTYKVTYTDGVEEEEIFADEIHEGLLLGTTTPTFDGTPLRTGYLFKGWNPSVAETVTKDVTYTAVWAEDKNNDGIADDEETKCTVTYKDGVGGEAFEDQVYENLLHNYDEIPEFKGTPTRLGYLFKGWDPQVNEKVVTKDLTFTATWEKIETKPEKPVTPSTKPSSKPIDPCTERIGTGWLYDEAKGYCVYKGSGQMIPNTSVK